MNVDAGLESAETAERSLSRFYEIEPRARVRAVVAGRSHPGKVRTNNEDNYLAVRRYRGRDVLADQPAGRVPRRARG